VLLYEDQLQMKLEQYT